MFVCVHIFLQVNCNNNSNFYALHVYTSLFIFLNYLNVNCTQKESKIWLDTDLKMILLDHQNNFVKTLKIMSNAAKNFDFLATLSVLRNYFDNSKLLF